MKFLKAGLLAMLLLLAGAAAEAQQHKVTYYSKSGMKKVTATEAHYFEIQEESVSGAGTRTRFLMEDSAKIRQFTYSSLEGGAYNIGILDGPHYEWYNNGKLKEQATYRDNKLSGEYKGWYNSGKLHYRKKYRDSMLQDTLVAYYETGEVRRIELYDGGTLVSGKLYNEAGGEIEFFPMDQMPVFPGGELKMLNWLGRNIKYPKQMRKEKVNGLVVLSFIVRKDGSIGEVEVIKELHPAADAEALRMLSSMPVWQPGLQEGKPVDVRYNLPIKYTFN